MLWASLSSFSAQIQATKFGEEEGEKGQGHCRKKKKKDQEMSGQGWSRKMAPCSEAGVLGIPGKSAAPKSQNTFRAFGTNCAFLPTLAGSSPRKR